MYIQIPSQVAVDSLFEHVNDICAHHGHMMFKSVLADVFHQCLEVVHLCHGDASVHAVWVVGHASLAEVALDAAHVVVGRDAEEGEVALRAFAIHGSEGVDLAQCASEHAERTQLEVVLHEALGEVSAVCAHALVTVFGKVVVPVEQCGGATGCSLPGITFPFPVQTHFVADPFRVGYLLPH